MIPQGPSHLEGDAPALPVVGLLYAGEMGCALAALLLARGHRVVTTVAGRSAATAARCREHGIEVLASLADVTRAGDIVLSLVPPAAAVQVAEDYLATAHLAPPRTLFVDANSIGPDTAKTIAADVTAHGIGFVDAAINGLAVNAARSGTLFISGPRAAEVASLFDGAMRTQVLGDQIGQASAMKMLLAGVSKGVCALLAELLLLADAQGMADAFAQALNRIYPGIGELVERMLPTYAHHASRRATEMRELEQTIEHAGLEPCVIAAVRRLHDLLAAETYPAHTAIDVGRFIQHLSNEGFLAALETHSLLEASPPRSLYGQ